MLSNIRRVAASFIERLRQPGIINEEYTSPAGSLSFKFIYEGKPHDVTIRCIERVYVCTYSGLFSYTRVFKPIYEVYSVVGGRDLQHELMHVFKMTINFPAIGNSLCDTDKQGAIAIDAYISVLTLRFKAYLEQKHGST